MFLNLKILKYKVQPVLYMYISYVYYQIDGHVERGRAWSFIILTRIFPYINYEINTNYYLGWNTIFFKAPVFWIETFKFNCDLRLCMDYKYKYLNCILI